MWGLNLRRVQLLHQQQKQLPAMSEAVHNSPQFGRAAQVHEWFHMCPNLLHGTSSTMWKAFPGPVKHNVQPDLGCQRLQMGCEPTASRPAPYIRPEITSSSETKIGVQLLTHFKWIHVPGSEDGEGGDGDLKEDHLLTKYDKGDTANASSEQCKNSLYKSN
ncbi:hypothetical protein Tco_1293330 [Tanacetum coccineum]